MAFNLISKNGVQAKLEGLPELKQRLAAVLDRTRAQKVKPILTAGAELIRDEARKLAPRSTKPHKFGKLLIQPGTLRDAIKVTQGNPAKPFVYVRVAKRMAPYAKLVEFGTEKMAAEPFFRPAIKGKRGAAVALIAAGLRKLISTE